ncbi:universal stress protein [Sinosporangium siamense]|uniref:Stress-inducible protein n=1 Tax=Sinosporangium siamense TaxID=1367973 RepID=A0A919RH87_9ACTN|nr:universal stress protein [Sinosporangium siamense]GII93808.1 stress-inducible protein [Sinosporangium siamense]
MRADEAHAPVVVGYDGSPVSEAALRWAAKEAQARFTPLVVCHSWEWPFPMRPRDPSAMDTVRGLAEHTLSRGADLARRLAPGVMVRPRLEIGSPSAVLLIESAAAAMVVTGTRGLGGFEGLRLGSTALQVVTHAWCPVVLLGGTPSASGRIVVGVDASPGEGGALAFAFEEAALHQVALHAVRAWSWEDEDADPGDEIARRAAAVHFQATVSVWREKFPYVEVTTGFVNGPPTEVLTAAAERAELLVLGHRPRREGTDVPIGLVTQSVLLGAPCPVAVVRALAPSPEANIGGLHPGRFLPRE